MASKTIDHLTVQVGVTPYDHGGMKYDALRISVMYSKGYGFYVSWTPVEVTEYGFKTGCMSVDDPLEGGGRVFVERVPKNNAKRLETMHAALQLASEGIALYFDLRLWTQMNDFIRYVCLYGFTPHYQQQVENLKAKANINSNNSEDESMKTNENNIETKSVAMEAQVTNVKTDVDIAEVDDIVPVVTKKSVAQAMVQAANGGPATTMPLGKHGTLVVAGVGGTKADVPQTSDIKPQTSTKVQDSVPQGKLQYVTYEKQKTNKTTGKPYTVTHGKIMGFAATDEAYQRGVELHGAVSGEMVDGVKMLGLYFSHRYAAAAKDVCDALNAGKPFAECVAIINNATEENAKKREEWKAKLGERIQKREERKAAREAKKAEKTNTNCTNDTNQPTAGYSAQDVAAMLQKVLAGGELPKDVEALMKKAA